jgi:hypothetical protein
MTRLLHSSFNIIVMIISFVLTQFVSAQDVEAMSKALTTLYEQVALVDAYKTYCDTAVPDSNATNTQAVSTWKAANNVSQIEQLVTQFSALSPEMAQAFQTTGAAFQAQFAERFAGTEAEACGNLPELLQGEDSSLLTLYPQEMQLLPSIAEMLGSGQTSSEQSANPLATPQIDTAANTQPATTPPATGTNTLSGLYSNYDTGSTFDGTGTGSFVANGPDYWYFFPDGYVYKGDLAHQGIDCTTATNDDGTPLCDTYVIAADTITFGDGKTRAFVNTGERLEIDGNTWFYSPPESFTLEGSYEAVSGGGVVSLNISTINFLDNGTFSWGSATGVNLTDTQEVGTGDGTETTTTSVTNFDESSKSGSYVIADNSVTLTYSDGTVKNYVFDYFEDDEGFVDGVYIGGRLYY